MENTHILDPNVAIAIHGSLPSDHFSNHTSFLNLEQDSLECSSGHSTFLEHNHLRQQLFHSLGCHQTCPEGSENLSSSSVTGINQINTIPESLDKHPQQCDTDKSDLKCVGSSLLEVVSCGFLCCVDVLPNFMILSIKALYGVDCYDSIVSYFRRLSQALNLLFNSGLHACRHPCEEDCCQRYQSDRDESEVPCGIERQPKGGY